MAYTFAFWHLWTLASLAFTVWGRFAGGWLIPFAMLVTYACMRANILYTPIDLKELAAGALWLCCAAFMLYHKAWLPGFFIACAATCYPIGWLLGARIEWLGGLPIATDTFAALALVSIGGGLLARSGGFVGGGIGDWVAVNSLGVAAR